MQMANKVTLKNIASFSKGEQINGDLLLKDGAYPYLNGGINPSGMWNECNVDGNTVTISEGGNSCGYVNYMDSPFWCGAHCYYLYDVKCDIKFLYHALKSSQDRLMSLRSGACMPNIKKKDLGEFEIPEPPPLAIQREIAYNLDKVSEAIEQCRKILEKLDYLVKAKFAEMFGDCVSNPKNWHARTLEDIADVGSSKRVFVEELKDSGVPFYRGTEVGALAEGKKITPELFITKEHYDELCEATGAPKRGDLLMPSICPDGRIWVVDNDNPFYFKDGRVLWVHNIAKDYNPIFLLQTLKNRIMSDYNSIASGTTFAELKIFALKKCKVFDVPLPLQEQFAEYVQKTDRAKAAVKKTLEKAQVLKAALMQKYFG